MEPALYLVDGAIRAARKALGPAMLAYVKASGSSGLLVRDDLVELPAIWPTAPGRLRAEGWRKKLGPEAARRADGRLCVILGLTPFSIALGTAVRQAGGRTFHPMIGMAPTEAVSWLKRQVGPEAAGKAVVSKFDAQMSRDLDALHEARRLGFPEPAISAPDAGQLPAESTIASVEDDFARKLAELAKRRG